MNRNKFPHCVSVLYPTDTIIQTSFFYLRKYNVGLFREGVNIVYGRKILVSKFNLYYISTLIPELSAAFNNAFLLKSNNLATLVIKNARYLVNQLMKFN